jgi:predicted Zn finger-like uncharacterized protein
MNVRCEECGATYNVSDSKLVREVNLATCRACGHRILIRRGTAAPAPETTVVRPAEPEEHTTIAPASALGVNPAALRHDSETRSDATPVARASEEAKEAKPGVDLSIVALAALLAAFGTVLLALGEGRRPPLVFGGLFLSFTGSLGIVFLAILAKLGRKHGKASPSIAAAAVFSFSALLSLHLGVRMVRTENEPAQPGLTDFAPAVQKIEMPSSTKAAGAASPAPFAPPTPTSTAGAPIGPGEGGHGQTASQTAGQGMPGAASRSTSAPAGGRRSPPAGANRPPSGIEPGPPASEETSSNDASSEKFEAPGGTSTETPPAAPTDLTALKTAIDTMLRNDKNVKSCFIEEKKRSGMLPRITVQFTSQPSGALTHVSAADPSMRGSALDTCLAGAIGAISLQPHAGDARRITYPFTF